MKICFLAFILCLIFLPSCYAARIDGPYEGRVIDADTGKPIEGVVILGVWYKEEPTVAGAVSSYYDAMETVTDKNGDFKIKGLGLLVLSHVMPAYVVIFKAGHEYVALFWEPGFLPYKSNIKWEGKKAVIPLRRFTMEGREKQGSPDYPSEAPKGKIKSMLREINKDRMERGLKPVN